jgi:SPP1 family predicted phage head-tail adaptor
MRAGKLRHRVTIQQLVAGSPQRRPTGEPDEVWTDLATVWADVRPLRGKSLFEAQQAMSKVNTVIEIRYSTTVASVTAAMRVSFNSQLFDIEAVVSPEYTNERLLLQCSTGVNEG